MNWEEKGGLEKYDPLVNHSAIESIVCTWSDMPEGSCV